MGRGHSCHSASHDQCGENPEHQPRDWDPPVVPERVLSSDHGAHNRHAKPGQCERITVLIPHCRPSLGELELCQPEQGGQNWSLVRIGHVYLQGPVDTALRAAALHLHRRRTGQGTNRPPPESVLNRRVLVIVPQHLGPLRGRAQMADRLGVAVPCWHTPRRSVRRGRGTSLTSQPITGHALCPAGQRAPRTPDRDAPVPLGGPSRRGNGRWW